MNELEKELAEIKALGIKSNPMRLAYERQVHALQSVPAQMRAEGYSEEEIAREMHGRRRELGRQFKESAPPQGIGAPAVPGVYLRSHRRKVWRSPWSDL